MTCLITLWCSLFPFQKHVDTLETVQTQTLKVLSMDLFTGQCFELRRSRVVDCYKRLEAKTDGKRLEQLDEACLPGLGKNRFGV